MQSLPIDEKLPEVIEHLSKTGAVVIKAEPGAGKTTRVAPAILNAGLAVLPNGNDGQIILLQPRRVAARAAAARMSDEAGTALGAEIGYQVRHEGRHSKKTRILVCTEGIFLRRLQDDPTLEGTSVVIFDEFHERTIDSDLALAMTVQVKNDLRPDLKIVVMSATLDAGPLSAFLSDCPSIESPGRTFPVELEFLRFPSSEPMEKLAAEHVSKSLSATSGNLLVFLPGVREIRETESILDSRLSNETLSIMPLYGDMPLSDQLAVLKPGGSKKIVLATNVAETSLTIDGVTAVIDTGFSRVNKFDPDVGINKLSLTRISKASATQRAGRAGRTANGKCIRLWTEREHAALAEFETPEIDRVDLSECLLQLMAWGEQNVFAFPWFQKPSDNSIEGALILLEELDAIRDGKLTDNGKAMARFPLQPRLARLLLEGARMGQPQRAAMCAAMLAERPPFRTSNDLNNTGDHTDSDVLEQVRAIEAFDSQGVRSSIMGEIIPGAAKQIMRASSQLEKLLSETDSFVQSKENADEAVLRSIMAAFPDRICKRRQPRDPRGVMVGGRGVTLSDQCRIGDAPYFVALDLIDLNRSDLSVRRASYIDRSWLPENHITTSIEVSFDSEREKIIAFKRIRYLDLILDESVSGIPAGTDTGTALAEAVATNYDISALIDDSSKNYLSRVQCIKDWLPELELPDFGNDPWKQFLHDWCYGCQSIAELRTKSVVPIIQTHLTREQIVAIEKEAPEQIALPGGRPVKLQYEHGKPPVLAARIQQLFGMKETPRIARSRIGVMMHLLAPNYRVQQITDDLNSFWKNTYPQVRKDLRGRYPKHKWPEDPFAILES